MRLADYVIQRIYDECSAHIFTVTGRGILYLTDAIAKHGKMKCISVHHEQAGAYAAVSYGCYTGKPGVCLVSTGCASTNTITGLLSAFQDGVPCVFISGQNILKETVGHTKLPIRTFGSQETDIIPIVRNLTKYAVMITEPRTIAYELDKAISLSKTGVHGPVWIDIPLDIQDARIEPDELERYTQSDNKVLVPANDDIAYIMEALHNAERPVVLIGSGIRSADAVSELAEFVERNGIPLTYAHTAVDVYGLDNELSIGAVGSIYGTRAGNFAVQNSDLLLVLGCRMTTMTTGSDREKFARHAKTIVVDIDKDEHRKGNLRIDRMVISSVKSLLLSLNSLNPRDITLSWIEKCKHWKHTFPKCEYKSNLIGKIDLYHLAETVSKMLPDNSVVLCDAGIEELILPTSICFRAGMRCIHPAMQGTMGFALPGAIGAYLASGELTCAVIGDGSVMMNLQELQTIAYNQYPIKIIIVNNNMYAVIRKRQNDLFRSRTIGTDCSNGISAPDFRKIADCFGIQYFCIEKSKDLETGIAEVFDTKGAVICEIMSDENQEYLRDAYTRNMHNRIVHRPIEDLYPFIDRDLFISEMIVEPIDQ